MKNIFNVALAVCCLQILNPSSIFAQTKNTATTIDKKCTQCTDFKTANDMESYGKSGCRIFQALCDLNVDNNTIIIQSNENTLNTTDEAISAIGGTTTNLMFYIETEPQTDYQVKPKITFVDSDENKVADSNAAVFQQYIFNDKNELYSVKGIEQINGFKSNESMILVTKIELPESMGKPVFIKIDLTITDPLTAVTKSIKTYYKQINL